MLVTTDLIIMFFAAATGFVSAGVISSLYQLVMAEPARFDGIGDRMISGMAMAVMLMFAGPAILMRNAIRGRRVDKRPIGWLAASAAIAGGWSVCSGVVVMQFALAFRDSLL